jgi:hypothetical protein
MKQFPEINYGSNQFHRLVRFIKPAAKSLVVRIMILTGIAIALLMMKKHLVTAMTMSITWLNLF